MLVLIHWRRWRCPTLTAEEYAAVAEAVATTGARTIARRHLPVNGRFLIALVSAVTLGVIVMMALDRFAPRQSDVVKIVGTVSAVLFAWGFVQLPLWLVSTWIARVRCEHWLKSLSQSVPKRV
jgi:hypothetical protein